MPIRSLGQKDALEEGMAIHSSILVWRIPWTEEPVHRVPKSWTQLKPLSTFGTPSDCSSHQHLGCELGLLVALRPGKLVFPALTTNAFLFLNPGFLLLTSD